MENDNMRKILIAMSITFNGDFLRIFAALKAHVEMSQKEIENAEDSIRRAGVRTVTIIDSDYPDCFKKMDNPPIVLYTYDRLDQNTVFIPQGITASVPMSGIASEYFVLGKHMKDRCERTNMINSAWRA